MNKRELLTVTAEDIALSKERRGECDICRLCPVALAMKRQMGEEDVYVGLSYMRCGSRAATTSRAVRKFMDAFDYRMEVEPHRFWVTWREEADE